MTEQMAQTGAVQSVHPITWIDRELRVPGNRRKVLVFGETYVFRGRGSRTGFLGTSRYNTAHDGSGIFDIEKIGQLDITSHHVTHWAEITDPEGRLL